MTVYFLETDYGNYGWNDVFVELVNYMKKNHNAKIRHQKGGFISIDIFDYKLSDCELCIHDEENDILRWITFADYPINVVEVFEKRNNPNDILVLTQFYNRFPKEFDRSTFSFKLKNSPWYSGLAATNFDFFYNQRTFHEDDDMIDKMFFLGRERPDIVPLRNLGFCNQYPGNLDHWDYLYEAIKYKMGISISGVGEVCYRDFEYLAIGLPMLRMEYMVQIDPPLIPNYHYIAVKRTEEFPWSTQTEEHGGELYVEAYKKRFMEVKDDKEFLKFIANNGRKYYEKYSHPYVRLKHLLNIIEL